MEKNDKIPQIRFVGFNEPWEQRKLEDILTINSGRDYKHLKSGTIPVYGTGGLMLYVNDKLSTQDSIGIGRKGTINKPFLLMAPFWTVDTLFFMTPKNRNDLFFILNLSKKIIWKKYDESTGVPSLSKENIKKIKIKEPDTKEKIKIGEFNNKIDNLITLHQRKLEKLKTLKKSLLEKMFPKSGYTVPDIRFKNFNDPWEQRKLEDIVKFFSGLTYSPKDIRKSGVFVIRSSNVKNGEIVDADNVYVDPEVVNSQNVKKGDIIVVVRNGSRALIGKHAEIRNSMPNTVIGAFMTGIRSEHSSFINSLLNTSTFEKEIAINMGATINQITGYMFSKMNFKIPIGKEQNQIGECFKQIDNLITLHQRQLEKLNNIKKSLLEKMFV